jgi:5'-nucleotidase
MKRVLSTLTIAVALLLASSLPADAGEPVHIMLANDDGIDAPGLAAMAAALAADPAYRVTVVAPTHQQSVSGHSLVTRGEVEVTAHQAVAGCPAWSVAGTPATVARIGLTALLVDDPPALIVSGINHGENDGLGAWTSGTVAVAREGAYAGIPAVAVSLQLDWADPKPDFAAAARWAKPVIDAIRDHGLPPATYLNVNIPRGPAAIRGYRVARMGLDPSEEARYVAARVDSDGTRWYASVWKPPAVAAPGGDTQALNGGWVTLVPLGLDLTVDRAVPFLQQLAIAPPMPTEDAPQR